MVPSDVMLAFLIKAHDDLQGLTGQLKFDKLNFQHKVAMQIYASIFELTGSSVLLIINNQYIAVPIIFRTLLEAFVDLFNLINDPEYSDYLILQCLKEQLKMINEAKSGENEFLKSDLSVFETMIDSINGEVNNFKERGIKLMSIKGKFEKAGMLKEYSSVYNMICDATHNGLLNLFKRHDKKGDIIIYKNKSLEDISMYIALITEYFVKATEVIHEFFKSPVLDKIQAFRMELTKLDSGSN